MDSEKSFTANFTKMEGKGGGLPINMIAIVIGMTVVAIVAFLARRKM